MSGIVPDSWRKAARECVDACLSGRCLLCGADAGATLCPACERELPRPGPSCPQCADPNPTGSLCGRCLRHPPAFARAMAPYSYAFPVDRLIQRCKYGHDPGIASYFGQLLIAALPIGRYDLIAPVPLHPGRLRERGFNQALEIARPLARYHHIPLAPDALKRNVATTPQADLPLPARAANVRNAFWTGADFKDQTVLLIDDVLTTGATLSECARVLLLHGASRVDVAVVARTPHK